MKKLIIFALSLFTLNVAHAQHWSYEGKESPAHWAELNGFEDCGQSTGQSPINIVTSKVIKHSAAKNIGLHYDNSELKDITDNGHTLQFDFNDGNYVTYDNKQYVLAQFHAHEESEHTIDGVRYPLELHFVHKAADGTILVLAVMVKEGQENSYFEKLKVFKTLARNAKTDTDIAFSPAKMYPKNKTHYSYIGSLTTPPCSGNVIWIVFKDAIEMNENEVKEIAQHLPKSNNRPIQQLSGRKVSLYGRR